eukprot:tig00020563_g11289.t1
MGISCDRRVLELGGSRLEHAAVGGDSLGMTELTPRAGNALFGSLSIVETTLEALRPAAAEFEACDSACWPWISRSAKRDGGGLCILHGGLRVGQFSNGQSNPTYFVQAGEHAYVLRKKPAGKLLPSAHAVEREFRVMRALGRLTTVPVPEAILLCEDPAVIGTPFFLMRYERGRLFQDPSLPGMEPAERAAVYESMGDTLAKLHAVDCKALGLADCGRVDGYSRRQVARWTAQYEASKTGTIEAMDRLAAWLAGNVPPEADSDSCLVHGDFRLDNLVFRPTHCGSPASSPSWYPPRPSPGLVFLP